MSERTSRLIKIIRIAVALLLSLLAFLWINEEHFGLTGKVINIILFVVSWAILGYDMLIETVSSIAHKEEILSENLLMLLASIGAFSLLAFGKNECFEAVLILMFFQIGELFEDIAKDKTRDALTKASELRSKIAHKKEGESFFDCDPSSLKQGDVVAIYAGELLPCDGVVLEGEGRIDASSLTGESKPIRAYAGKEVAAGTVLKEGTLVVKATSDYENNTVAKILALIEEGSENKSRVIRFIHKFASIYTPVVFGLAILLAVVPPLFLGIGDGEVWSTWIFHGLCVLVISCPCSIVASIPLAYFAGMGLASRKGILIKGAEVFDRLNNMGVVFTDKTGTLTKGEFKLLSIDSVDGDNDALLGIARMCEARSNHPIAKAIMSYPYEGKNLEAASYEEIAGKGTKVVFGKDTYLCGSASFLEESGISVKKDVQAGTAVYFAKNGAYLGVIILGDEVKESASALVNYLHKYAMKIHLLSGDKNENAETLAATLGLDGYEGECTVARKKEAVELAKAKLPGQVAFMGDGINDASAIASSDLGIAMGALGSDVAMECADVVIMNDDPSSLASAHRIARSVKRQAILNIVLSLTIKVLVIVLSLLVPGFPLSLAVIADTGLLVLCVLLSISLFLRKKL